MMENEEKEDLLLEVTESEDEACDRDDNDDDDGDDCDCYIEEKIYNFAQAEKESNHKGTRKALAFAAACLLMFSSSSVFIVTLPIYLRRSTCSAIPTYGKLVALSTINAALLAIVHLLGRVFRRWANGAGPEIRLRLPNVIRVGALFSVGSIALFWLIDGNYVSCHLQDPLKGCAIVFSLLFYFVLSRRRMSVERIFCAVTVIVGVFVTIDFGICDKFRCRGSLMASPDGTSTLHFLYVVLYIVAHGVWVLHLSYIEIYWTRLQCSNSNLSLSVLSNVSKDTICEYDKRPCQSLSVICHEAVGVGGYVSGSTKNTVQSCAMTHSAAKKSLLPPSSKLSAANRILKCRRTNSDTSLNNSVPCLNQFSHVSALKEFPITSTPIYEVKKDASQETSAPPAASYDVTLWQHVICCLVVLSLCCLVTMSFREHEKSLPISEIIDRIRRSLTCHAGLVDTPECNYLFILTIVMTVSYLFFVLSGMEILKRSQSAITVVSVMMMALPMSNLFWSLYQLNDSYSTDILEFNPEVTGETVCAMLGFPIIGVGNLLLLKSHIREFKLSA